ncbi:MAG: type VI secretion system ATPase TssH, partial [Oscillospiraceae bacterium]|nr:type VI secretion system ATPase TssH [Oscillospiraceae bacterium]
MQADGSISEEARAQVNTLLHQQFRPEFLNRLDEIVFYKPLQRNEIFRIVDLLVADLQRRLNDKQLTVKLTDAAKQAIVDNSYDVAFGARPLRRYLQQKLETLLAKFIIGQDPAPGTALTCDYVNGEFVLNA